MRLSPCVLVQPDGWARGEREGYGGPRGVTSLPHEGSMLVLIEVDAADMDHDRLGRGAYRGRVRARVRHGLVRVIIVSIIVALGVVVAITVRNRIADLSSPSVPARPLVDFLTGGDGQDERDAPHRFACGVGFISEY